MARRPSRSFIYQGDCCHHCSPRMYLYRSFYFPFVYLTIIKSASITGARFLLAYYPHARYTPALTDERHYFTYIQIKVNRGAALLKTSFPSWMSTSWISGQNQLSIALETLLRVISTARPPPYDAVAFTDSHYPHPIALRSLSLTVRETLTLRPYTSLSPHPLFNHKTTPPTPPLRSPCRQPAHSTDLEARFVASRLAIIT